MFDRSNIIPWTFDATKVRSQACKKERQEETSSENFCSSMIMPVYAKTSLIFFSYKSKFIHHMDEALSHNIQQRNG